MTVLHALAVAVLIVAAFAGWLFWYAGRALRTDEDGCVRHEDSQDGGL